MAGFVSHSSEFGAAASSTSLFHRSTIVLPKKFGVVRVVQKQNRLQCNALALRGLAELPWVRVLLRALHISQVEAVHTEYVADAKMVNSPRRNFGAVIKDATLTAVQVGLSLTGAAFHLASRVVTEWQQKARDARSKQHAEMKQAADRQKVMNVQTQLQYEIQRKRLETQGKDQAFVSMLHVLDRCHLDHDVKWALVQKHTADKAEFSERLQQLYNLAEASKDAVDTLLRPEASRKEINSFWKSPETVAIIAEEDKLKSLVFAQMLQASS